MNFRTNIVEQYPNLAQLMDPLAILKKLEEIEPGYELNRDEYLQSVDGKGSNPFWATIAMAVFETNEHKRSRACACLLTMEEGLGQAARTGKEKKFKSVLTKDGSGFFQVLAELHLLRLLGPLASEIGIEEPASLGSNKNFDLRLSVDGVEIHLDSKMRSESPVGEFAIQTILDISALLGETFDSTCIASVNKNRLSQKETIELACIVDESRRFFKGERGEGIAVNTNNAEFLLSGDALSEAMMYVIGCEKVSAIDFGYGRCAFVSSKNEILLSHPIVRSIEFVPGREGVAGYCHIVPNADSQSVNSPQYLEECAVDQLEKTDYYPEHLGISSLVAGVYLQLPDSPYNIVCIGVGSEEDFNDIETAVHGEILPPFVTGEDGSRFGGLFNCDSYKKISGVIGFTMDIVSAGPISARFFKNEKSVFDLPHKTADRLCEALSTV